MSPESFFSESIVSGISAAEADTAAAGGLVFTFFSAAVPIAAPVAVVAVVSAASVEVAAAIVFVSVVAAEDVANTPAAGGLVVASLSAPFPIAASVAPVGAVRNNSGLV